MENRVILILSGKRTRWMKRVTGVVPHLNAHFVYFLMVVNLVVSALLSIRARIPLHRPHGPFS